MRGEHPVLVLHQGGPTSVEPSHHHIARLPRGASDLVPRTSKALCRLPPRTLLHFVEVCGMLTLLDRKKKRERVDVPGALCKALGWYFPLLAKMGVESVEHLIFTKYPRVCPYCRKSPHVEQQCKLVKGTEGVLSHECVRELTEANWQNRPAGLNEWQQMYDAIYPRTLNSRAFSIIALLEELGELAEAVRVFDRYPHYFYGEGADVFSYLMGLANEYTLQCSEREETFDYELEFLARYPGLCVACGARVCICPTVPPATGRPDGEGNADQRASHLKRRQIRRRRS
jgi:NTP pyrophosphatase (non-canonical NTP hydrolase)